MVPVTGVITAGVVAAATVPLTRLAYRALLLHFLTKQLEHTDAAARLEVSLVVARQMGIAEPTMPAALHGRAPETAPASGASASRIEVGAAIGVDPGPPAA